MRRAIEEVFALNDVKDFQTVRIVFSKTGRARYISHLDLNRTMQRAVRRAALPIWYTEGFNKHPYLTFAAPLSLGYEGERETMDLRLADAMPMEELVHRLDAVMPEGLHILSAGPAIHKAGEVAAAVYRITVPCTVEAIHALLAQPEVSAQKRTKKKEWVTVDLRPVLDAADSAVSTCEEGACWELTLPCNSTLSVNPSLVMAALREQQQEPELAYRVCRLRVLASDGTEFT